MLPRILIALLLGVLSPVTAQESKPAGLKLIASDAKRLISEVFGSDAKKAERARVTLEATRPEDRMLILEAIKAQPFVVPKGFKVPASRTLSLTLDVPESDLKKGKFNVIFPRTYDPKKPAGLLFRFHGSGDTADGFSQGIPDPKQPFICITPEVPTADRMGWNQTGGFPFIDRLFKYVAENFNVDFDHVYLSGYSAGGAASYMMAQVWPHRVAGIYSMGRVHHSFQQKASACMDTLRGIPSFFVVGLKDREDRVQGYRDVETYYKANGLPGVFHFVPGREHEYLSEFNQKAYDYLAKATRNPFPKEIRGCFYLYANSLAEEPITSRRWWFEVKPGKYNGGGGATFHALVDGNTIDIQAPEIHAGGVYLADSLLDMDKPVLVKLNGREVINRPVERSVAFLLDWYALHRDRGQLYWNRVDF